MSTWTQFLRETLENYKALELEILDVAAICDFTDVMMVASGTSKRHVSSIAENVALQAKQAGYPALSCSGIRDGEWALLDFGDVVIHIMQKETREFYNLEKLWRFQPPRALNQPVLPA